VRRLPLLQGWQADKLDEAQVRKRMLELMDRSVPIRQIRDAVFRNLWREIGEQMPVKTRCNTLVAANDVLKFAEYADIVYFCSNRTLQDRIARNVGLAFPGTKVDLVCIKARKVFERMHMYPEHPMHTEEAVTRLLVGKVWQYLSNSVETKAQRRTELKELLESIGCTLRSDSSFAQDYIDGSTCASVEEVAAVLKLTSVLFSYSHKVWSNYRSVYESQLTRSVYDKDDEQWIPAVEKLLKSDSFKQTCRSASVSYYDYSDDDDSYRHRRKYHRGFRW
jgi:hypothetical protein